MPRSFAFAPATREQIRSRICLEGPAGSGKSLAALTIAQELASGGEVAVIDTERGSARLYADRFSFQLLDFAPPYDPRDLIAALEAAAAAGFPVVVIDSLSHFWAGEGGTLQIVDETPGKSKFTSGWAAATPIQNRMIDAVLSYPGHVIVTLRTKTAYVLQQKNGKEQPVKVGTAPVQREGVDYEFTVVYDVSLDHSLTVTKSRSSQIAEVGVYGPSKLSELAADLTAFLNEGEAVVAAAAAGAELKGAFVAAGWPDDDALIAARAAWKDAALGRTVSRSRLDALLAEVPPYVEPSPTDGAETPGAVDMEVDDAPSASGDALNDPDWGTTRPRDEQETAQG